MEIQKYKTTVGRRHPEKSISISKYFITIFKARLYPQNMWQSNYLFLFNYEGINLRQILHPACSNVKRETQENAI